MVARAMFNISGKYLDPKIEHKIAQRQACTEQVSRYPRIV